MLALAIVEDDGLYWELGEATPKSPKRQKVQVEEDSLNDSISTIKTSVSTKKPAKSTQKSTSNTNVLTPDEKTPAITLSPHKGQLYLN